MTPEREAFEAWYDAQQDGRISPFDVWRAACAYQRKRDTGGGGCVMTPEQQQKWSEFVARWPKADAILAADAELKRLREQLEIERMRVVACDVVAMSDTPESAAKARDMHPSYRSAACESVARRVDECTRLRADKAKLLEALNELCQSVVWKEFGECRGFTTEGPIMRIGEAVSKAKEAINSAGVAETAPPA